MRDDLIRDDFFRDDHYRAALAAIVTADKVADKVAGTAAGTAAIPTPTFPGLSGVDPTYLAKGLGSVVNIHGINKACIDTKMSNHTCVHPELPSAVRYALSTGYDMDAMSDDFQVGSITRSVVEQELLLAGRVTTWGHTNTKYVVSEDTKNNMIVTQYKYNQYHPWESDTDPKLNYFAMSSQWDGEPLVIPTVLIKHKGIFFIVQEKHDTTCATPNSKLQKYLLRLIKASSQYGQNIIDHYVHEDFITCNGVRKSMFELRAEDPENDQNIKNKCITFKQDLENFMTRIKTKEELNDDDKVILEELGKRSMSLSMFMARKLGNENVEAAFNEWEKLGKESTEPKVQELYNCYQKIRKVNNHFGNTMKLMLWYILIIYMFRKRLVIFLNGEDIFG